MNPLNFRVNNAMKILSILFVVLALVLPCHAVNPLNPANNPVALAVEGYIAQDEEYQYVIPTSAIYFAGQISEYQQVIPFVESYGMTFVTNYDFKVDEEDEILETIDILQVYQWYTNPEEHLYYQGAIDGLYNVLNVMNNWPGSGPAVPGTTP